MESLESLELRMHCCSATVGLLLSAGGPPRKAAPALTTGPSLEQETGSGLTWAGWGNSICSLQLQLHLPRQPPPTLVPRLWSLARPVVRFSCTLPLLRCCPSATLITIASQSVPHSLVHSLPHSLPLSHHSRPSRWPHHRSHQHPQQLALDSRRCVASPGRTAAFDSFRHDRRLAPWPTVMTRADSPSDTMMPQSPFTRAMLPTMSPAVPRHLRECRFPSRPSTIAFLP